MYFYPNSKNKGFTLLELIITIILLGIVGTMLITFMDLAIKQSSQPIFNVQRNYALSRAVERMNMDYLSMINPNATASNILDTFESRVTSNTYGNYTITNNIRFNDFQEDSHNSSKLVINATNSTGDILRLTVSDPQGQNSITTLFFEGK